MDCQLIASIATAVATAIAAGCSMAAVLQTRKQVALGIKQQLFALRVERWLRASSLLELFSSNDRHLDYESGPVMETDLLLGWLTNNSWLEDMAEAANQPLINPGQKVFLTRKEEMERLSQEITYAFEGDVARLLSGFVSLYAKLLQDMYGYRIVLKDMSDYIERYPTKPEDLCQQFDEPGFRKRVAATLKDLREAHAAFDRASGREAIEEQIRLG